MPHPLNKFTNPNFLINSPVLIKISEHDAMRATVAEYDVHGYWLLSDGLSQELIKAFGLDKTDLKPPVLFVPMHRVEWLVTRTVR